MLPLPPCCFLATAAEASSEAARRRRTSASAAFMTVNSSSCCWTRSSRAERRSLTSETLAADMLSSAGRHDDPVTGNLITLSSAGRIISSITGDLVKPSSSGVYDNVVTSNLITPTSAGRTIYHKTGNLITPWSAGRHVNVIICNTIAQLDMKIWLHVIGLHCPVPKVIYPVSDCSDFSNPAPQTGYSWSHSIILFYRNMIIWQHVIRLHWETRLLNHNLIVTSLAWERNNLIKLFPIKLQSEWQEDIITGTHTHNLTPWSAGRLHDITECHRITDTSTERLVTQVNRQL